MADKAELEALVRSLNTAAVTLNDMLSKAEQPKLAPSEARIKRTSDMTYHDYLLKVLNAKGAIQAPSSTRMSYRLQEDLELLLELSKYNNVTLKSFEETHARGKVPRTVESMRSRYADYLSKVGEPEMKRIISWVEKEGVEGFLSF